MISLLNRHSLQDTEEGFTLLEVLVSISIMSLIMLVISGGLSFGIQVWERQTAQHGEGLSRIIGIPFLERQFSGGLPLFMRSKTNKEFLLFHGGSNLMSFVVASPARSALAVQHMVILTVQNNHQNNNRSLVLLLNPILDEPLDQKIDWKYTERRIIRTGLEHANFEYYGQTAGSQESIWQEKWVEQKKMPEAIRVTMEYLNPEQEQQWIFKIRTKMPMIYTGRGAQNIVSAVDWFSLSSYFARLVDSVWSQQKEHYYE